MKRIVKQWEHCGYQCEIAQVVGSFESWYCGYVTLPTSHPDYNKDYEQLPIEAHGGLTFGENGKFGFDCMHGWEGPEWGKEETVFEEVNRMAEQFKERE